MTCMALVHPRVRCLCTWLEDSNDYANATVFAPLSPWLSHSTISLASRCSVASIEFQSPPPRLLCLTFCSLVSHICLEPTRMRHGKQCQYRRENTHRATNVSVRLIQPRAHTYTIASSTLYIYIWIYACSNVCCAIFTHVFNSCMLPRPFYGERVSSYFLKLCRANQMVT